MEKKWRKRVKHGGEKVKELTTASHALTLGLPLTLMGRIWQGLETKKAKKRTHSVEKQKGETDAQC